MNAAWRAGRFLLALTVMLGAAAFLALLARGVFAAAADARTDGGSLRRPAGADAGLARELLGIDGDLAFRDALRLARRGLRPDAAVAGLRSRLQAEIRLTRLASHGAPAMRSRAANLLGLLELRDAAVDGRNGQRLVAAANRSLEQAIRLDPTNEDAKYNLELLLSLRSRERQQQQGRPHAGRGRQRETRGHRRVASNELGAGY